MTDQFAPFPTNTPPLPGTMHASVQPNGPVQAEPKKRGPRRQADKFSINNDPAAVPEAPKKMGRPKKEAAQAQAPALSSLFQILAGLQSSDVVPLTSCYETLAALPVEDRTRVLGMLNRVWG